VNDIVCISPIDGSEVARRGAGMSRLGFEAVTRPKSFHLRIEH
jgi:hypothetical protein